MCQNQYYHKTVDFVNEVLQEINGVVAATMTEYFLDIEKFFLAEVERLRNRVTKWSNPDAYDKCLDDLLQHTKSSNIKKRHKKNTASPFHEKYIELYSQFLDKTEKIHKVSLKWMCINAIKIFNAKKLENQYKWGTNSFKACLDCMMIFIKRKNIKFRKRKCGNEQNVEECIGDFEEFINKV